LKTILELNKKSVLSTARETLRIGADALIEAGNKLDDNFVNTINIILRTKGRVILMGLGKSGYVGAKIAATLASTGTPSFFVHIAEAIHGDLGMITSGDVVMIVSNSGNGNELKDILPYIKRLNITLIAITGDRKSVLGECADLVISRSVIKEACPINLAPTTSTTTQMAIGDALATVLIDIRGFNRKDFMRSHPGGAIGRKNFVHTRDIMRIKDRIPQVKANANFIELIKEMSLKGMGLVVVVDGSNCVLGVFTDGDLRRLLENGVNNLESSCACDLMSKSPFVINPESLATEAARIMEQNKITTTIVVNKTGQLIGILNSNDLMLSKVI
jgi:arabinose-5-phosphate isomerase